jgi:hypothetical protein
MSHKGHLTLDAEQIVAEKWLKDKSIVVPFVLDANGEKVYQLKYQPTPPANPIVYNREIGLGLFCKWTYREIREFLDDYLEIKDILTLACTSKEWNFFCRDEKYSLPNYYSIVIISRLWKRLVKRSKKGNIRFRYTWKDSFVIHHNEKTHFAYSFIGTLSTHFFTLIPLLMS